MIKESERDRIVNRVIAEVEEVWQNPYSPIEFTYCTRCSGYGDKPKQRCITSMLTLEALCPTCWGREREQKYIAEAEALQRPKLDVDDFAKI